MDQYMVSVLLVSTGKTPVLHCLPVLVPPSPGCRGDRGPHSLERGSTSCHCVQGSGCCPSSGYMTQEEPWVWEPPGLLWAALAKMEPHGTHLCPAKSISEVCAVLCPSIQPMPCHADLSCTFPWPPAVPQVCTDMSHPFVSLQQPASMSTVWDMGVPWHLLASDRDCSVPSQCQLAPSRPQRPAAPHMPISPRCQQALEPLVATRFHPHPRATPRGRWWHCHNACPPSVARSQGRECSAIHHLPTDRY